MLSDLPAHTHTDAGRELVAKALNEHGKAGSLFLYTRSEVRHLRGEGRQGAWAKAPRVDAGVDGGEQAAAELS